MAAFRRASFFLAGWTRLCRLLLVQLFQVELVIVTSLQHAAANGVTLDFYVQAACQLVYMYERALRWLLTGMSKGAALEAQRLAAFGAVDLLVAAPAAKVVYEQIIALFVGTVHLPRVGVVLVSIGV